MLKSVFTTSMYMGMDYVPVNNWQHGAYIVIPEFK